MRSALQSPQLRRIFAAYTVNRLGTWFGFVALAVTVFDKTHSAVAVSALFIAGQVFPAFAVPAVVARVEASKRRRELANLYFFEAVSTIGLALLVWRFSLAAVLVLVALDGTAALAANALLRAALAREARNLAQQSGEPASSEDSSGEEHHEAERNANALLNLAFSLTFMLGPALGGLLVASAGSTAALLIDAVTFVACGALLIDLRPHVEEAGGESVRARLAAAWTHINDVPALHRLLLTEAVALIFFESAAPVEVVYAKATLHVGNSGYGLLVTAWGVGVVLGSLVFARAVRQPLGWMLSSGALAVGLAYVGLSVAPSLAVACAAAVVGGCGQGVQWASLISAVQRLTPPALQGRIMGAVESIGAITPAIGLSLGGAAVALSTARIAFRVAGICASLTTIAFVRLSLRGLDPPSGLDSPEQTLPTVA